MKYLEKLAHFSLPRYSNNQKAKLLHTSSLIVICLVLVLFQFSLNIGSRVGPNILGYAANISVDEVIRLTNEKRTANGLNALSTNSVLSQAALAKGTHMLEHDYWAHVAPDGTQPWYFFKQFGYGYKYAGENLARDFSDASSAVEAWMASPTHKENMLSPNYQEIGIGVVEGDLNGVDTTIIVQLFGTSYADQPSLPVAVASTPNPTPATPVPSLAPSVAPTPEPTFAPVSLVTPEPLPSVTPAPVEAPEMAQESTSQILISPFVTTKGVSVSIVGILLVVLVLDGLIVSRRRISRIGGRTFAHIAFLGMILTLAIILKAGQII